MSSSAPAPAPHELPQQRLLELLRRHDCQPLILLVAPAGSGKSMLAAAYARTCGSLVGWLTLQADDRDARTFFGRLADVLEATFAPSHAPRGLRTGLAAGAGGVALARLLVADLAQAPARFILVLDNFHVVQNTDQVLQAVDTLAWELPELGQMVLTAREPPLLSMTRLVAHKGVFGLGAQDLHFTEEELYALREYLSQNATPGGNAERAGQNQGSERKCRRPPFWVWNGSGI